MDGQLQYQSGPSVQQHPTAREVWDAVFGNSSQFETYPSSDLQDLRFSRFPAEPCLLVSGRVPDSICLTVVARSGESRNVLGSTSIDQVVLANTWYPLPMEDYEETFQLLESKGIRPGTRISVGQLIWLKAHASLGIELLDELEESSPQAVHAPASLDSTKWGLNAELYPYQKDGIYFLGLIADQGLGCILGDEMGLGKTMQVIALMLSERYHGRGATLVVAPATLLENWRRELVKFAPSLMVLVHIGPNRAGMAAKLTGYDVVVTSYDMVVRDEPMLSTMDWNLLVLDEAQNIKNPGAQRTDAVKKLSRRVSLAVTGTPVENRLSDLWSLSDFALPGLLGTLDDFESQFDNNAVDAAALAPIVAPILLRRKIEEVAKDLPERIDIPQPIAMSRVMAELYEQVRKETEEEYGKSAALVSLQRLRMFCTHPNIVGIKLGSGAELMPKYQRLLEILQEIFEKNEKCLVFTSYTAMADMLVRDLPSIFREGWFGLIDGRVAVAERQGIVDTFSDFQGFGALVLNPRAAGVGLNITAANHVIHYNPEWNPALEDQASARAYRRKQEKPVTVHHLYFADSVEEVIVERLSFKRRLSENAAVGHKGEATANEVMRAISISPLSNIGDLE